LQKPAVKSTLNIQLLSTVAVGNGENDISSCVLSTGGKVIDTYTRRRNPTDPAIKIQRILPKRIEFLNGSRLEYVELADAANPIDLAAKPDRSKSIAKKTVKSDEPQEIAGDGDKFTIPRSVIEDATAKVDQLYTDIRAVPYFEEGSPKGFKLLSVKKGSLFDRLGLRRGDILKTINGNMLSIESGMQLFKDLKDESNLILDIDRKGVAKTLNYEII
jgi:type II secretion system protein C